MTTPTTVQVQVSATTILQMVAEQGALGLMFRNVPIINDAAVSDQNPIPAADLTNANNMLQIDAAINAITQQFTAATSNMATLLTQLSTALAGLNSSSGGGSSPSSVPGPIFEFATGSSMIIDSGTPATTSFTASLQTSGYNEVAILQVYVESGSPDESITVSSITDNSGNTWSRRSGGTSTSSGVVSGYGYDTSIDIEVWWAFIADPTDNTTVTINLSGIPDGASSIIYAVKYLSNPTNPWDTNNSFPAVVTGTIDNPTDSISGLSTNGTYPTLIAFSGNATDDAVGSLWTQYGFSGANESDTTASGDYGIQTYGWNITYNEALVASTQQPFDGSSLLSGGNVLIIDAFVGNAAPIMPPGNGWSLGTPVTQQASTDSSASLTITPVINAGSLLLLFVIVENNSNATNVGVNTITDNRGLTWTRRFAQSWASHGTNATAEIWYAISTGAVATTPNITFTDTFDNTAIILVEASGLQVDLNNPFDPNSGLPAVAQASPTLNVLSEEVSTTTNVPLLLAFSAAPFISGDTVANTGWSTAISVQNDGGTLFANAALTTKTLTNDDVNTLETPYSSVSQVGNLLIIDALAFSAFGFG